MTSDRLRECLGALNWSTAGLAVMAQVSPVTARRWLNGKVPIPPDVAHVIEQIAALAKTLSRKSGGLQLTANAAALQRARCQRLLEEQS
jgi:transcriptional regulator with XRE-family HTH domain